MKQITEINTYYIAKDGTKFKSATECAAYEDANKVPKLHFSYKDIISEEARFELSEYVRAMMAQFSLIEDKEASIQKVTNMLRQLKDKLSDVKIYEC